MECSFRSTTLCVFLVVLSLAKETSGDNIIYRTPCCGYNDTISDLHKTTPDFIEANGFIAETHLVITEDGYIVTLHRIAGRQFEDAFNEVTRPRKPVVLFQHGMASTSDCWLMNGRKSFPYLLADSGYDVWLSDSRGNFYSRRHVKLSINNPKYWDFSFHEQAYYDLPAMINYILRETGEKKIFYVGHSRGTTMAYVLLSTRPEYNYKFHLVVNFAPAAYLNHSTSSLRVLLQEPIYSEIKSLARYANTPFLARLSPKVSRLRQTFCGEASAMQALCVRLLFSVVGYDYDLLNRTMIPVFFTHFPYGGALKEYLHYIQLGKTDIFRRYDYGAKKNLKVYGQREPPQYSMEKITAPISLHYGTNDLFTHPQDFDHMSSRLRSVVAKIPVPFDKFNHMDFLWGARADELLYRPTLHLMNSFLEY